MIETANKPFKNANFDVERHGSDFLPHVFHVKNFGDNKPAFLYENGYISKEAMDLLETLDAAMAVKKMIDCVQNNKSITAYEQYINKKAFCYFLPRLKELWNTDILKDDIKIRFKLWSMIEYMSKAD